MRFPVRFLLPALAAAALTLAGCHKQADNGAAPAATTTAAASGPVGPAPAGGWVEQVVATPEGGFQMGNPNAPVKLVEYGSLTCPHCADFDAESTPTIQGWVAAGKLSYEYRNFVRDSYDVTAALLARCGGPAPFFKLTEQIYAGQKDWVARIQKMNDADRARIQALTPAQQFPALAQAAGLDSFVGQRGIPSAKAQACLADQGQVKKLVDMEQTAVNKFNVQGTPTFIINGEVIGSADWATLRPRLQSAIGG